MKHKFLLITSFIVFIHVNAQLPATNFFYYASTGSSQLYNYNTTTGVSSLNTISLPAGNIGLAVNNNFFGASPAMTFYTLVGTNFYYYNGTTWVNTGHVLSDAFAVNIGGAGPYIYCYSGFGGQVYRYNGTGTPVLVTTLPSGQGPYDITGDASGNFFVMKTVSAPMWLRQYSPTGTILATYNMVGFPAGSAGGGFAFIGGKLYADISGVTVWGTISGTTITYGGPLTLLTSSGDLANWPLPITPLPIEILSFDGYYNAAIRKNTIHWSTLSEINNDYFSVEFSNDGYEWNWLMDVSGAENSNTELNYSIDHESPFSTTYYRLKQTDLNGGFKYYDPITISSPEGSTAMLYPNPATGILNIATNEKMISYLITDEAGKVVMQGSDQAQLHQLDISSIEPGLYFFTMNVNGEITNSRFVKN